MSGKHKGMSETSTHLVAPARDLRTTSEWPQHVNVSAKALAQDQSFETAMRTALHANKIGDARTLVANAEAVLMGHASAESPIAAHVTRVQLATAKARIAMALGDGMAARAILVKAIETDPDAASLRALMTEVMLAEGRATDVRPVLKHLGNEALCEASLADIHDSSTNIKDTSG